MSAINERLAALRRCMQDGDVAAVVLPCTGPHLSEHAPPHWRGCAWFSGFSGSTGTLVVTAGQTALWVDGRYTIQAEEETGGTGITLFQAVGNGCIKVEAWLRDLLPAGGRVVCDGGQISAARATAMRKVLDVSGLTLQFDPGFIDAAWPGRPGLPEVTACVHELRYCGKDTAAKLDELRDDMRREGASHYLLSSLDDVAWVLNLRGDDIPFIPVAIAGALINGENTTCFIRPGKCLPDVMAHLEAGGVDTVAYECIEDALGKLPEGATVMLDPERTCASLRHAVPERCPVIEVSDPVERHKAVKNKAELRNMQQRLLDDCAVFARLLCRVETAVAEGRRVMETAVAQELEEMRSGVACYLGPSFKTTAAYGEHAAMMHYHAVPDTDCVLEPRGLFLLDAGGQYLDGTTDITRTIALGPTSEQERHDYTLVLKGHIALSRARFRHGVPGSSLDILARGPLWEEGINYDCGTGHGLGFCLCAHEGSYGIRMNGNSATLEPGMIVTNEPGIYRQGRHGVRTENVLLVVEQEQTDFGRFLGFQILTFCPIDTRPVLPELLSNEEIAWLDGYHAETRRLLTPLVDAATREWLERSTSPVKDRHESK
jgi:Xaa-Pro aminopeptidase